MRRSMLFFIFNGTATTEIYTLSLHDALPIFGARAAAEHFGGGQLHYGADATFSAPITAWLRFALSIGARQGRSVEDRKSTRLNSSHSQISYAVFCLKKKKQTPTTCMRQPST